MAKDLNRPSFTSPLYAWVRQGSKEFAQGLPATRDSIRPVEEPGTLGNPTPQQITEAAKTTREPSKLRQRFDSRAAEHAQRDREIER